MVVSPPSFDNTPITLNIHHQNSSATLLVPSGISIHELCHQHLSTLNTLPSTVDRMIFKLILKSPPRTIVSPGESDHKSLHQLGFNSKDAQYRILLLTTELSEVQRSEQAAQDNLRREQARQAALKNPAKIRNTTPKHRTNPEDRFSFRQVALLPNLPFESRRQELVDKLATDPSILKQMIKFKLEVGSLGELHPWLDPQLLGVNQNAGQSIRLRLLTDDLKSVRPFTMVRRVLSHELAHNVFGPHDNQFKELDSKIHKGMLAYDESVKSSSYRLGGDMGDHYEPETAELDFHCSTSSGTVDGQNPAHGQQSSSQLNQTVGSSVVNQTPNDNPRLAAAEAALKRAARKK
ncbi:hypothetical protein PGT21_025188 [Puccinia graminis f. sp. tritici]|uniref:WLM domain-containing protein n=2 Tax=Puccinia graminis f. sp. tritici TaxID=56615 RepID=E3KNS2_PUCGT|nr:uncharacterized protein PGTG_11703 [Puccinia graminis f. sp. tritici CRL 75-36-700-3]EFP85947.2 hypothetical protein PGTG_11703 [Puccinia graminis f. sp. tritici CRL 75-36-700-3]KAA1073772.1 hypothetical protein PGT21_025188 [Puccinia graminis f. sp. tritici]